MQNKCRRERLPLVSLFPEEGDKSNFAYSLREKLPAVLEKKFLLDTLNEDLLIRLRCFCWTNISVFLIFYSKLQNSRKRKQYRK